MSGIPSRVRGGANERPLYLQGSITTDTKLLLSNISTSVNLVVSPLSPGSTMLTLVIVILVVVILLALLVGCILYLVKRKKTPDSEAGAAIRMSAITTPASHTTQAGVTEHTPSAQVPDQRAETPYSTPQVGFASGTTDPLLPSPERPDTLPENPPPYSGEEDVPQYPPPGKSYPWQQD